MYYHFYVQYILIQKVDIFYINDLFIESFVMPILYLIVYFFQNLALEVVLI